MKFKINNRCTQAAQAFIYVYESMIHVSCKLEGHHISEGEAKGEKGPVTAPEPMHDLCFNAKFQPHEPWTSPFMFQLHNLYT